MNIEESGHTDVAEVELDEAIPKSTMYGVVVNGKFIAKGSKATMKKLAKEKAKRKRERLPLLPPPRVGSLFCSAGVVFRCYSTTPYCY